MEYDSTLETTQHIRRVMQLLNMASMEFIRRANCHDDSKLQEPEKTGFDTVTNALRGLTYGSDEYKQQLEKLKPILQHHYENNSHHPEHYGNGVDGFDLFDLVEMFFDWKAASERHADGNIYRSIDINHDRFKISPQICNIFKNTARNLKWEK